VEEMERFTGEGQEQVYIHPAGRQNAFPKLSELPPRGVNAITGGTGKYAGVRGEERFETCGNKIIITFHFID
jgi:hypothetical protein